MLSDSEIKKYMESGDIVIDPPPPDHCIQPASVDLHLGHGFTSVGSYGSAVRTRNAEWQLSTEYSNKEELYLGPQKFCLATTAEKITLSPRIVARVEGKSSIARLGLVVHATAGFIDPGFSGNITLELFNMNSVDLVVEEGQRICQLSFHRVEGAVDRPYGHPDLKSRYQHQAGTSPSKGTSHE